MMKGPQLKVQEISPLADCQGAAPASLVNFLWCVVFSVSKENAEGVRYVELPSAQNIFETGKLVWRPCYDHLSPLIHRDVNQEGLRRVAITGTPGIGKSVYGAFLVRYFVHQSYNAWSVVYWERTNIFLLSSDDAIKKRYKLELEFGNTADGRQWVYGFWKRGPDATLLAGLLDEENLILIHDPQEGERFVAEHHELVRRVIYILSQGHSLFEFWGTKGFGPHRKCYVPPWTPQETKRTGDLLLTLPEGEEEQDKMIEDLFYRFGGCARAWKNPDMLATLKSKAQAVVRNNGYDLLKKTEDSRGSIVHMLVDFDEDKPVLQYPGENEEKPEKKTDDVDEVEKPVAMEVEKEGSAKQSEQDETKNRTEVDKTNAGVITSANTWNTFDSFRYVFGSPRITEFVDEALQNAAKDQMELCLAQWTGESGYESIYGALFELRCRRILTDDPPELRMRIVHRNDRDNTEDIFKVRLPRPEKEIRIKGHDPSILKEDTNKDDLKEGAYFRPFSSNFPTYDSVLLVSGNVLASCCEFFKRYALRTMALLLQMTVSGSTGLPRRPNHVVRQYMRKTFDDTFTGSIDTYNMDSAVTTFVVPTECFQTFLFQYETWKNDEENFSKNQPDYQVVIEIPNIFYMKPEMRTELLKKETQESRKRKHRYMLRSRKKLHEEQG